MVGCFAVVVEKSVISIFRDHFFVVLLFYLPHWKHRVFYYIWPHFCILLQKSVKQEVDFEHSYLEGEVEADGQDEDYSLEHQVSIPQSLIGSYGLYALSFCE